MQLPRFLSRSRHIDDHALLAVCLEGEAAVGPAVLPAWASAHLAACPACADRHRELREILAADLVAASDELDQLFSPQRLAQQREQIMRRLEQAGRPARVIPFPRRGLPICTRRPGTARWVAMAAAAGLIVGVAAGQLVDVPSGLRSYQALSSSAGETAEVVALPAPFDNPVLEERFLLELEAAMEDMRVAELQALDALTPRVREIAFNGR